MPHAELTPRSVTRLRAEPGRERSIYFDTHREAPRGFCVRVNADGALTYYLLATHPDSRRRLWVRLGDAHTLTLDAARQAARAQAGDIARGTDPIARSRAAREARRSEREQGRRQASAPTVAQLVRRYIDTKAGKLSRVTEKDYRRLLAKDIQSSALGARKARDIVRADLRDFLAAIAKRAPSVANYVLSILRAAYRWGQLEELSAGVSIVERDPTRGIEPYAPRRRRDRVLTDAEIPPFWNGVESLGPIRATYLRLLLLVGLRRGESHAACWRDVDLEAGIWRIPPEVRKLRLAIKAKTGPLEVPLATLAVRQLRELQAVTGRRERMFRFGIGLIGYDLKTASGLRDITIHDLRRSCSAGLERIGAPPYVISLALGHARLAGSVDADLHYVLSRRPGEYRLWLERWAAHVERLVSGERPGKVVLLGR